MSMTNTGFEVGEIVSYTNRFRGRAVRCTVLRAMPVENAVRSYRIRDETEGFERSVPEGDLTRLKPSTAERVFGL